MDGERRRAAGAAGGTGVAYYGTLFFEEGLPDRDMHGMGHCNDAILEGAGLTVANRRALLNAIF